MMQAINQNGKAPTLRRETIDIRGTQYLVTELTGEGLDILESAIDTEKIKTEKGLAAEITCRCLLHSDGSRVYADADVETVNTSWPGFELKRIAAAAIRLSRLDDVSQQEAKKN